MTATLYTGDALQVLKGLPDGVARMCCTSPPYWGLRDYGVSRQIGLEATPEKYTSRLVDVFREVRRVLRDDGTLWLNLGDSYTSSGRSDRDGNARLHEWNGDDAAARNGSPRRRLEGNQAVEKGRAPTPEGLKPKDLVGIPWRVAFALQADGWYLRSDIIWHKPNPMPESVTDRPTKSHEYVFLLSKRAKYYFDAQAIAEEASGQSHGGAPIQSGPKYQQTRNDGGVLGTIPATGTRNARSVWTLATTPYPGAHFATFPPELAQRCILAGSSQRGGCPQCGKPWERETVSAIVPGSKRREAADLAARPAGTSGGFGGAFDTGRAGERNTETVGWSPTCDHGLEPVPDTVLDPFSGSGTTASVAVGHGRHAIGIELNPKYQELALQRIGPMLCDVEAA